MKVSPHVQCKLTTLSSFYLYVCVYLVQLESAAAPQAFNVRNMSFYVVQNIEMDHYYHIKSNFNIFQ